VTTDTEYETALRTAERELHSAATAEDVRRVWRAHMGTLGHRALGRLLLGRPAGELAARRRKRVEEE
jgi:hypothetical protein